jgi:tetratricopeptide (TPR) repeat protein
MGRHFMAKRSPHGLARARVLFEQARTENGTFPPCLAELACCMALSPYYVERYTASAMRSAMETAAVALKLDPECAAAHTALGLAHLTLRSRSAARASFEKAIELGGDDSRAYRFFADYHVWNADLPKATFCAIRSVDLDPASPVANSDCAQTLFYARRFEDALPYAERAVQLDDTFANGHYMTAQILHQLGCRPQAAEAASRAFNLAPHSELFRLTALSLDAPASDGLRRRRPGLPRDDDRAKPATAGYGQALFHAWRGETALCLQHLQQCVEEYAPFSLFIRSDPNFDDLHDRTEFRELCEKLHVASVLRPFAAASIAVP